MRMCCCFKTQSSIQVGLFRFRYQLVLPSPKQFFFLFPFLFGLFFSNKINNLMNCKEMKHKKCNDEKQKKWFWRYFFSLNKRRTRLLNLFVVLVHKKIFDVGLMIFTLTFYPKYTRISIQQVQKNPPWILP